MLKSVHIKNYLSCEDVYIGNLGNVTALVGRNGAGKSNILRAILGITSFASFASGQLTTSPLGFSDGGTYLEFSFDCNNKTYHYSYDNKVNSFKEQLSCIDTSNNSTPLFKRKDQEVDFASQTIKLSRKISSLAGLLAVLPEEALEEDILPVSRFLSNISYYALQVTDSPSNVVNASDFSKWLKYKDPTIIGNLLTTYKLLDLYFNQKERFDEVKELLNHSGLELVETIIVEIYGPNDEYYDVLFSVEQNAQFYSLSSLSYGTQRVLSLITSIIYDQSSVMLIEQPEDGIHRSLLHKVINLCKQYAHYSQMIFATHSPMVINNLSPEDIRLVAMEDGKTQCVPLSNEDLDAVESYLNDEGSLSEFIEILEDSE